MKRDFKYERDEEIECNCISQVRKKCAVFFARWGHVGYNVWIERATKKVAQCEQYTYLTPDGDRHAAQATKVGEALVREWCRICDFDFPIL